MLKTVCIVTFLLITTWGCVRGNPVHRHKRDEPVWTNVCGNSTKIISTSILKGKNQKLNVFTTLALNIKWFSLDLELINKTIMNHTSMNMCNCLTSTDDKFPKFDNRSKAIHRDLQIYIAIFDHLRKSPELKTGDKEVPENLLKLRELTRALLCFMEDMLNGTDHIRIATKYIKPRAMENRLKHILDGSKLDFHIKNALDSMTEYSKHFKVYIDARIDKLKRQRQKASLKKCVMKRGLKACRRRQQRKLKKMRQGQ
ncbi:hypothetical protein DMENIID0001_093030 [Sergentomyia squamirostris]